MLIFFFEKQFFLISHFMLFSTLKENNIEKCLFTYWLNGRWFLQIVDRDSWNLYPLYPRFPCSDSHSPYVLSGETTAKGMVDNTFQ